MPLAPQYKLPRSVLVVIYTLELDVLLLERADHPGYWQSVTGSQNVGESLGETAIREVSEETGLAATRYPLQDWHTENIYQIYEEWRYRYAPGVTHNTEHVFGLALPHQLKITLAPREHRQSLWLPFRVAAEKVFSSSNAEAILHLPQIASEQSPQKRV